MSAAQAAAGKVQRRRTIEALSWPIEVPLGDWERTLQTARVEPASLEPAVAWRAPGGEPVCSLASGGAFGSKSSLEFDELGAVARRLADESGHAVVARLGAKRRRCACRRQRCGAHTRHRCSDHDSSTAGRGRGGRASRPARFVVGRDQVHAVVRCGTLLDVVVLRSYCTGAAHMALGWVRSDGISVDPSGELLDFTVCSLGVIRAVNMPPVDIEIVADDGPPVNGSDAVCAAVALAAWHSESFAPRWPTMRG